MGFFRNVAGLLATSAVTSTAAMLTGIVLARFLTPADRGLFAVAMSFATISIPLVLLGQASATIYRIKRAGTPRKVVSTGVYAMLGAATLFLSAAALASPWLRERFLEGAPALVLGLALATVPFKLLNSVFSAASRGVDRFDLPNVNDATLTVVTLIATAAALIGARGGLISALAVSLAAQGFFALVLGARVLSITGFAPRLDLRELGESLRFGLKSCAQAVAGQLHERIDVFMLAYLLGDPARVAFYAIAAGVIDRLKTIPEALSAAAFPQLAGYGQEEAAEFACRVSRQATLWGLVTAVGLGAAAPILLPLLYGQPYQASVLPFLILLPGSALLGVYRVLSRYFMAINRQQTNLVSQAVSVVVNVGLNLWLIPLYGLVGAALASLVSYSLEAVLITLAFRRSSGRGLRETFVPRRSDLEQYRRRLLPLIERLRFKRVDGR